MLTKQQRDPYIWDDKIKIKTKDGNYDYEEETKAKVLKKDIRNDKYRKGSRNSKV